MRALLAKINVGVTFENKQFSKIISVALYVKIGAVMRECKNRATAFSKGYYMYFFDPCLIAAIEHCCVAHFYHIPSVELL